MNNQLTYYAGKYIVLSEIGGTDAVVAPVTPGVTFVDADVASLDKSAVIEAYGEYGTIVTSYGQYVMPMSSTGKVLMADLFGCTYYDTPEEAQASVVVNG